MMTMRPDNRTQHGLPYYLRLFGDDMQAMAGDAYRWAATETGGALYGLWSHAGRPVIMLASPAGAGACRERAHFAQDPDHLFAVNNQLQEKFGLQYLGNWHSHHVLGLDQPSAGDVEQIHRVASRSKIASMVQIIFTRGRTAAPAPAGQVAAGSGYAVRQPQGHRPAMIPTIQSSPGRPSARMHMKAFLYTDARQGTYKPCAVQVLSEPNPIRAALAGGSLLNASVTEPRRLFPLDHIVYEPAGAQRAFPSGRRDMEQFLAAQLDSLPEQVAAQTEIFVDDDLLCIAMASAEHKIVTAYRQGASGFVLTSVGIVRRGQPPREIT